jgi:hypothetical protein
MTTQTVELTTTPVSEDELVHRWRLEQLRKTGYPARAANAIASRRDIDLHLAIELMRRGCTTDLAVRILL